MEMVFIMFDKRKDTKQGSLNTNENNTLQNESRPQSRPVSGSGSVAVIGAGITVNGDISGDENLVVKGKVDGTITLNTNEVQIDSSAMVTADISAKVVQVTGTVSGDIIGNEKVIVNKSGKVNGNIVAPRVILEDGAIFKGSIDMNPPVVKEAPVAATSKKSHVQAVAKDAAKKESSIGLN